MILLPRLEVKRLHIHATLPTVAHPGEDLAYDLYAVADCILVKNQIQKVRTGISARAYEGENNKSLGLIIKDRSSMAAKGIRTSAGVIDPGYTGEIMVLMSLTCPAKEYYSDMTLVCKDDYQISRGDKIAQMVPVHVLTGDVIEVKEHGMSSRGNKGFGSSGHSKWAEAGYPGIGIKPCGGCGHCLDCLLVERSQAR
jgi:dUTP pyrophosphatase